MANSGHAGASASGSCEFLAIDLNPASRHGTLFWSTLVVDGFPFFKHAAGGGRNNHRNGGSDVKGRNLLASRESLCVYVRPASGGAF